MKENQFMSILFWLYTQKTDDSAKHLSISIAELHWMEIANKANNKCPDAIAINKDLESIKGDLRKIFNQLSAVHDHVTGDMIKMKFTGLEKLFNFE